MRIISSLLTVATVVISIPNIANAGAHSGIRHLFSGPEAVETCALMAVFRAYFWGTTPGAASLNKNGKDLHSISIFFYFWCALTHDQQVYCWGHNESGQMGNGTLTSSDEPTKVLLA